MSCSLNAWSPGSWPEPAWRVAAAALSKIFEPVDSVWRKVSSSIRTTVAMRSKSAAISG